MKRLFTLSVFLSFFLVSFSQNAIIHGTVTQDSTGVPGIPLFIDIQYYDSTQIAITAITDQNGEYLVDIPFNSNAGGFVTISLPDCDGTILSQSFDLTPNQVEYIVNFEICTNGIGNDSCVVYIVEEFSPAGFQMLTAYTGFGFTQADTYLWSTGDSTQSIIPADAGEYCVTITEDSCTTSACYTFVPDTFGFCFVWIEGYQTIDTTGVLEAFAFGVPPYTYSWSTGDTSPVIIITEEGLYCATVTDALGCVAEACYDYIFPPDCFIEFACDPPGALNVFAYGVAPFSYLWNTGDTTSVIFPTEEGEYCVTVTDATGCVAEGCTFFHPFPIDSCIAVILPFPDSTTGAGGYLLQAFAFGFPPLEYLWSTGDSTEFITVTNLNVEYCVTITDVTGCVATACIDLSNSFCFNFIDMLYNPDGTATLTASGSPFNPAVSYLWSNGVSSETITVAESGTYCVTVTHQDSCISESCAEIFIGIGPDSCSSFVIAYVDSSTAAGDQIVLEAIAFGVPPYTYQWNTGEVTPFITVTDLTNLLYCVTITDATGCVSSACAQPIDFLCFGWIDIIFDPAIAGATLSAFGASPLIFGLPGSYLWSTGETTQSITVQTAGTYCVTMTFADGCTTEACIDFYPGTIDTLFSSVNGFVIDASAGPISPFEGQVNIYAYLNSNQFLTLVDSTTVDNSGYYSFDSIPIGVYLVQAVPAPNSSFADVYFPTYHYDAVTWEDALPVFVPNFLNVTTDILMVPMTGPPGSGLISGSLEDESNIMVSLPYLGNDRGGDLEHIVIILWDEGQNPLQMVYTDSGGNFEFTDLPWGTYFVSYDVPGIETVMIEVTIHEGAPQARDIIIELGEPVELTTATEELKSDAFRVWPNPTREKVFIAGDEVQLADFRVEVINNVGSMIHRFEPGELKPKRGEVNLGHYPPGLYLFRLSQNDQQYTLKVLKQ